MHTKFCQVLAAPHKGLFRFGPYYELKNFPVPL